MRLIHELRRAASSRNVEPPVDRASAVASAQVRRGFADLAREVEATGHPVADVRKQARSLLIEPPVCPPAPAAAAAQLTVVLDAQHAPA